MVMTAFLVPPFRVNWFVMTIVWMLAELTYFVLRARSSVDELETLFVTWASMATEAKSIAGDGFVDASAVIAWKLIRILDWTASQDSIRMSTVADASVVVIAWEAIRIFD